MRLKTPTPPRQSGQAPFENFHKNSTSLKTVKKKENLNAHWTAHFDPSTRTAQRTESLS